MKKIPGYNKYSVTEGGRVYSHHTGKFLKSFKNNSGYHRVALSRNGVQKKYLVSRLVAQTYIPNPGGLETVDHINHDLDNNSVSNLQWMSRVHNSKKGKFTEQWEGIRRFNRYSKIIQMLKRRGCVN